MPTKSKAAKKKTVKFYVDCWQPSRTPLLDAATFEKFLRDTTQGATTRRATWATRSSSHGKDEGRRRRRRRECLRSSSFNHALDEEVTSWRFAGYLHVVATAKGVDECVDQLRGAPTTNLCRAARAGPPSTSALSTCAHRGARIYTAALSTTSPTLRLRRRRRDRMRRFQPPFRGVKSDTTSPGEIDEDSVTCEFFVRSSRRVASASARTAPSPRRSPGPSRRAFVRANELCSAPRRRLFSSRANVRRGPERRPC